MICEIILTIVLAVTAIAVLEVVFTLLFIGIIYLFVWASDREQTDDWANDTRPDEDFRDDCL